MRRSHAIILKRNAKVRTKTLHCPLSIVNLIYAGMAELAVFDQAPPAEDTATVKKAQRSKFCEAKQRAKNFANRKSRRAQ